MAYLEKGLRNLGNSFLFGAVAVLVGYIARVILARTLPLEEFGLLYAAISSVTFLTLFTNLGLGSAQVKFIAHHMSGGERGKARAVAWFSILTRMAVAIIIGVVIALFAQTIALNYFKTASSLPIVYIMSVALVVLTLFNITSRLAQGLQNIFVMSFMNFLQKASYLILVLLLVWSGMLLGWQLMWIYVLSIFLAWLTAMFLAKGLRSLLAGKPKFASAHLKTVSAFALAAILVQAGQMIMGQLDIVMLTYFKDLSAVAIYNVVLPSAMALTFLGKSLHAVMFPMMSEMWAKKEKDNIKNALALTNRYVLMISLPIILTVLIFPTFLLQVFFGSDFVGGALALQILAVGVFFLNLSLVYQSSMAGTNKMKFVTTSILIASIANIILNFFLIPPYGLTGAALATTISYFILLLVMFFHLRTFISFKKELWQFLRLGVASIVFALVAISLRGISLPVIPKIIVILILAGIAYTIVCVLTGILSIKEVKFFLSRFRKG